MFMMFLTLIMALMISILLILLNSSLSKKNPSDREKPSPFECGFDMKTSSRISFSIRFFLIAVIFLIFDVEITLIVPLPFLMTNTNMIWVSSISLWFIVVLILGLYHEWNEGSLQWK